MNTRRTIGLTTLLAGLALVTSGCVTAHQVQLGEVDAQVVNRGERFELMVSETGINVDEAASVAKALLKGSSKQIDQANDVAKMFSMGPKTGNPVFDDGYSDKLFAMLEAECPSGRISGLTSIRETAKYPVVSGEIVKWVGYCLKEENK